MIASPARRLRVTNGLVWSLLACMVAACFTSNSAGQEAAAAKPAADSPTSAEHIQAGKSLFAAQCAFCHGRDAEGGEGGPDLMASALVGQDVRGNKIGAVVRNGRPGKMPSFGNMDEQQLW